MTLPKDRDDDIVVQTDPEPDLEEWPSPNVANDVVPENDPEVEGDTKPEE